jgi:anti-sigma regulatory factor (Ser/Thr protein kinase)
VDWLLSPSTPEAGRALRVEIGRFLRRHAADPDEVGFAELVVSELIANAFDHADGPAWVSLDWTTPRPVITVHDLGSSFELELSAPDIAAPRGRGLWLVSQVAEDLAVVAKRGGGKRVSATLPVTRREAVSFDHQPRTVNALPALVEAGPAGFDRVSFLRALVVELSRVVQQSQGPLVAEDMVAHVGATVGGQMEEEYRHAGSVLGQLTPQQIAECYVRLKAAINGDFYIIEVTDDRIVLGNRQCPFGETVRQSPALCRMTSSVFGGIAARNHGSAVVQLDERIAVGDPECRVTVLLNPADAAGTIGHRYRADPAESGPVR